MKKVRIVKKSSYTKVYGLKFFKGGVRDTKKRQIDTNIYISCILKNSLYIIQPYIKWYIFDHFVRDKSKIIFFNMDKIEKYILKAGAIKFEKN